MLHDSRQICPKKLKFIYTIKAKSGCLDNNEIVKHLSGIFADYFANVTHSRFAFDYCVVCHAV